MNKTLFIILTFTCITAIALSQDELQVKTGIKGGFEIVKYLTSETESFKKNPGLSFGLFTGISIYKLPKSIYILGLEINYIDLRYYRNNQNIFYIDKRYSPRIGYSGIFDEKLSNKFVEICTPLEVCGQFFDKNIITGFYVGPAIGLGYETMEVREISRSIGDTLRNSGGIDLGDESTTYSYPGGRSVCVPISINVGTIIFYKFLAIDLRYKYTMRISNTNHDFILQFGFAY